MRSLPVKAKQHFIWGGVGLVFSVLSLFMAWDWKAFVLGLGFGVVFICLGIWTIQSDRRIEDLKRQVQELDL